MCHTFLENANGIRNIRYVIPLSLVDRLQLYRNIGDRGLLRNNGTCLNYTQSYPRRIYSYRFATYLQIDSCTVKIKAVMKLHDAFKHVMSHHPCRFTKQRYELRHVQKINKQLQVMQCLLWQTFRTPTSCFTVCLSSNTLVETPPVLWHHLQHNPRLSADISY